VFHHHYYDAIAQVKCSLSRSDGDSNRFLTSWWFIPHTNYTHRSNELQITNDTILVNTAGQTGAALPRDCPTTRSLLTHPWTHSSRPRHTPFSSSPRTHVDPGPNSATSFVVKRYFIRPAKCEACVQHDKKDEQRSVLNRHRWKLQAPQNPIWLPTTCSARSPFIHPYFVIFRISSIP
jgi:hypothetical protein